MQPLDEKFFLLIGFFKLNPSKSGRAFLLLRRKVWRVASFLSLTISLLQVPAFSRDSLNRCRAEAESAYTCLRLFCRPRSRRLPRAVLRRPPRWRLRRAAAGPIPRSPALRVARPRSPDTRQERQPTARRLLSTGRTRCSTLSVRTPPSCR